jgi:putative transposase
VSRRPVESARYASEQFQRLPLDNGIPCSTSRAGNVWDTPAMESFIPSVATERTARKVHRTRDAARADVFDRIERPHDPRRRHSNLGYPGPMAFEDRAMQT